LEVISDGQLKKPQDADVARERQTKCDLICRHYTQQAKEKEKQMIEQ